MTNMDALTIPAAGGVDSTALIVGDYSDGNDGVVLKGKARSLADIKGQNVNLVEFSVSHYLLARALDSGRNDGAGHQGGQHLRCRYRLRLRSPDVTATVTWNPQLSEDAEGARRHQVFDSARSPARSST